ncbi:MAG: ATP synthase F1 subunit delta [Candidatus Doudnabacteria bacterium]|nr:ATP synthase F1 subunit delta [Candidatus Doudnabacteria bacterium]
MRFTPKQYAQALMESLESSNPKDQDLILDNFVKVLVTNNDSKRFEEIAEEFHRLELAKKGIKQAEITTAHEINKENEHQIIHELNKIVKGNLELKKKVDDRIIGGVLITMEDQMLDASVKNNLEQLKKDLSN